VRCYADATGHLLPAVQIAPVGQALDAVARVLGTDAAGLAALADRADTRAMLDAPILVPARDGRPGALLGIGDGASPPAIAVAALHGCAAEILDAVDTLDEGGTEAIVLAGSGAARPGLARAIADLSGRPVVVRPDSGESAEALGAAVQAAAMLQEEEPHIVAMAWGLGGGTETEPGAGFPAEARGATISRWRQYIENH
jgi:sugar (pentulose or hexulose) kinase